MKPLRNNLGHSTSKFLDVWDNTLFDIGIMRHIHISLERSTYDVIYFPIKELIYQDLLEHIWLIH